MEEVELLDSGALYAIQYNIKEIENMYRVSIEL